jgi:hypothetical protein
VYVNKEACELIEQLDDIKAHEAYVLYVLALKVGPNWRAIRMGYADWAKATKLNRTSVIRAIAGVVQKNLVAVERVEKTARGGSRETNTYRFTQNFIDQSRSATSRGAPLVAERDVTSRGARLKESKITDIGDRIHHPSPSDSGRVNGKQNGDVKSMSLEEKKALADAALKKKHWRGEHG